MDEQRRKLEREAQHDPIAHLRFIIDLWRAGDGRALTELANNARFKQYIESVMQKFQQEAEQVISAFNITGGQPITWRSFLGTHPNNSLEVEKGNVAAGQLALNTQEQIVINISGLVQFLSYPEGYDIIDISDDVTKRVKPLAERDKFNFNSSPTVYADEPDSPEVLRTLNLQRENGDAAVEVLFIEFTLSKSIEIILNDMSLLQIAESITNDPDIFN